VRSDTQRPIDGAGSVSFFLLFALVSCARNSTVRGGIDAEANISSSFSSSTLGCHVHMSHSAFLQQGCATEHPNHHGMAFLLAQMFLLSLSGVALCMFPHSVLGILLPFHLRKFPVCFCVTHALSEFSSSFSKVALFRQGVLSRLFGRRQIPSYIFLLSRCCRIWASAMRSSVRARSAPSTPATMRTFSTCFARPCRPHTDTHAHTTHTDLSSNKQRQTGSNGQTDRQRLTEHTRHRKTGSRTERH
jgi:hypothetical protein